MEFARVLNKGGKIILEYESSNSLELLGSRDMNKISVIRKTFYNHKDETIFYYSNDYIKFLCERGGFKILNIKRIHLISALVYMLTKRANFSAFFGKLDNFISFIPIVNKFSSNVILLAEKE